MRLFSFLLLVPLVCILGFSGKRIQTFSRVEPFSTQFSTHDIDLKEGSLALRCANGEDTSPLEIRLVANEGLDFTYSIELPGTLDAVQANACVVVLRLHGFRVSEPFEISEETVFPTSTMPPDKMLVRAFESNRLVVRSTSAKPQFAFASKNDTETWTDTGTGIHTWTHTHTHTHTGTGTHTWTHTGTHTWTHTGTATWTDTSVPTWTDTGTSTWTDTSVPTWTDTGTSTWTDTSTPTWTWTHTGTSTDTRGRRTR